MDILKKLNSKVKEEINTGFGANASDYGGRFVNKNGTPNIEKKGVGFFEGISWYHTMLEIPRWKFFSIIFLFYVLINFVFAVIYSWIGVQHLGGMKADTALEKFGEAYFFSAQTFTTVGYGRISPTGFITSAAASLEALLGLLSFALATGLLYGRFSKPQAYLRFSDNALLAPFEKGLAIMMKVAPYKNTSLTDAEATVTAGIIIEENGVKKNDFYPLNLEYNKVNSLPLSWTIVHPITENSPFYNFTIEDFKNTNGEIILFVKAFDDKFSTTVVTRTSYTFNEIVYGAKFVPMFFKSDDNKKTILDFDKLNQHIKVDISHLIN